ncbi:MAG TPA: nucleotidyltransferase domain-containing protein [Thermoplasmata archaeon]|nr:nucleotidyltransferase domain-containing protein [Thermoplasmata archaeon]
MGSPADGLIRKLENFRRRISTRYGVQRMILFGSRARGRPHRHSDVDLIIVSAKFKRKNIVERASPLYMEWDLDLPVDFLCYTPEEFAKLARRGGLVREALREGVPIS